MLRPFVSSRVIIDYQAFVQALGEDTIVCIDNGVLGAIRVLLSTYGLRDVNWATAYGDAGYTSPTPAEIDVIDNQISIFLEETNMSNCVDLTAAINRLADSNCFGCGPGSGGAGGSPTGPLPFDDTGWDIPIGFSGLPEYKIYKCKAANIAWDKVEWDMTLLLGGTLTTIGASILVATLISPIPFDEIFGLAAFLLGLLLQAVLASTASGILTELNSFQDEFVCAIYTASDATSALAALENWAANDASFTATEAAMFNFWLTIESVNPAFEKNALVESQVPVSDVDCLTCGAAPSCPALGIRFSDTETFWFEPTVGETYLINSYPSGGFNHCYISNHPPMSGCTCGNFDATLGGGLSDLFGSATQLCSGTYEHVNNLSSISGISTEMAEVGSITAAPAVISFKFDGWI